MVYGNVSNKLSTKEDKYFSSERALSFLHKTKALMLSGAFITLVKFIFVITLMLVVLYSLKTVKKEQENTSRYLSSPKIGDIYFIDHQKMVTASRPYERFRLAKLVDITGEVLTFKYGSLFYTSQNAVEQAIHYGQLRYKAYFESGRYDFTHQTVIKMNQSDVFYRIERPVLNKLYGNYVSPDKRKISSSIFIPGKKENNAGEALLSVKYAENNQEAAYEKFHASALLGFPQGQVNLAQMYLNDNVKEANFTTALHWLKMASFQSYKPAILKYVIVCQQVTSCNEVEFYQELIAAGVDIKVRALSQKIAVD